MSASGFRVQQHQIGRLARRDAAGRLLRPKYRAGLSVAVCKAASGVMPPRTIAASSSCTQKPAIMVSHPVRMPTPALRHVVRDDGADLGVGLEKLEPRLVWRRSDSRPTSL